MNKKQLIGTIIFNLAETYIIFMIGKFIGLDWLNVIYIMLLFMLSKSIFGKSLHYKQWYKCMIASLSILVTLYIVCKFNELQSITLTLISSYLMTNKANIKDIVKNANHWDNGCKHQLLFDYLKYSALSDEYLEAEKLLKTKVDVKSFHIYKRRFIDNWTYEKIREENDIENARIVEILDKCYFYLIGRLGI